MTTERSTIEALLATTSGTPRDPSRAELAALVSDSAAALRLLGEAEGADKAAL